MTKLHSLIEDLEKANARLKEVLKLKQSRVHKDATIQRFEFTFELCWKTMQEYIRDQGFDCNSPKNCFRTAAKIDLIKNPEAWIEYLKTRNSITHIYSEQLADKVYRETKKFPRVVDELLKELNTE